MTCQSDRYVGLLGCGKTTLIKKLLETEYRGQKVAIIENEIGAVNLDAGELSATDISVKEITDAEIFIRDYLQIFQKHCIFCLKCPLKGTVKT